MWRAVDKSVEFRIYFFQLLVLLFYLLLRHKIQFVKKINDNKTHHVCDRKIHDEEKVRAGGFKFVHSKNTSVEKSQANDRKKDAFPSFPIVIQSHGADAANDKIEEIPREIGVIVSEKKSDVISPDELNKDGRVSPTASQ